MEDDEALSLLSQIETSEYNNEEFKKIAIRMLRLVVKLQKKDADYGSSWKKRGGVGAFMMMARKWDRIENALRIPGSDGEDESYGSIFDVAVSDNREEGIMDDIKDLQAYLALVENEIENRKANVLKKEPDSPKLFVKEICVSDDGKPTTVILSSKDGRLVEAHLTESPPNCLDTEIHTPVENLEDSDPGTGYVDQDRFSFSESRVSSTQNT